MSKLKEHYNKEVKAQLDKKFAFKNPMQIPKLKTVVLHMGIAEAAKDKNVVQQLIKELSMISGQKPIQTKAKKAISNFKLREGQTIGLKVTLRGKRMYDFVYRFVNISCPRIRDFRGFKAKGDGQGNYNVGIEDQQIFPEINLDELKKVQGMHITFVTSAKNDDECIELLRLLGVPFKNMTVQIAA